MTDRPNYLAMAAKAERQATMAASAGIADGWRQLAGNFRALAETYRRLDAERAQCGLDATAGEREQR